MNLSKTFSLVYFLFASAMVHGQNIEEETFLHLNSSNVISGESILFSAFVNSKSTNKPSPLSKILYVELINDKGNVALQTKISLDNGRGYGDIFVSSMFSTGVYQLLAYTRWMKNFNTYFEVPIIIINPFETVDVELESSIETDWDMQFFIPKNGILLNQENTISYRVTAPKGKTLSFKGKIMNTHGTSVLDFNPIDQGIGSFTFQPNTTASYQVIIEDDSGEFYFFDMPKVKENGTNLFISESKVAYEIKVVSTDENFEGQLVINGKNKNILDQAVVRGSTHLVLKRTTDAGLYELSLLSSDSTLIDSKVFYQPKDEKPIADVKAELYKKRSEVKLKKLLPAGTYSVSTRKLREKLDDFRPSAQDFNRVFYCIPNYYNLPIGLNKNSEDGRLLNIVLNNTKPSTTSKTKLEIQYLPDYRGELINGKVVDKNSKALANKTVMYSALGTNLLALATTNDQGEFLINVAPINEDNKSYFSLLDTSRYAISIESNYLSKRPEYKAPKLSLDSMALLDIVKSSVHAQVENAYYDIKKDSTFNSVEAAGLFSEYEFFYVLDDYNRFPSIRETFIEYMPAISVRQKNGNSVVSTRSGEYNPSFNEPTLILLDGIPVDVESLYQFSPYKVKSVGVIGKRYYFGPKIFDGVISLQTFEGNLHDFKINEDIFQFTLKGLQPKKAFYQPDYSNNLAERIPDRREQLLWVPDLNIENGQVDLQFYTSDVAGKYEIVIEGFSSEGEPFSLKEYFVVE